MGYNFIALNMQDCAGGGGRDKTKSVRQSSKLVRRISGACPALGVVQGCPYGFPTYAALHKGGFFLVFFLGRILCDQLFVFLPMYKQRRIPINARLPFLSLQYDDFSPNLISYRPIFFVCVYLKSTLDHVLF